MISKIKRFLFGCNGCGECKVLLEKAKNEINNHKDYDIVIAKEIKRLQQVAQDYIIKVDQIKDENLAMRKEIVSLQTVRDNLIGERKDFHEQQKIVLNRLDREKDAHKLTQYNKDQTDKQYKDLAIQNKRMLDIVNDETIKARLKVLKKMGKLKDIEEYYASGEQSIQPLSEMIVKLDKNNKWQSIKLNINDAVSAIKDKPVDVLEGVTAEELERYNQEAKEAAEQNKKLQEELDELVANNDIKVIALEKENEETAEQLTKVLRAHYTKENGWTKTSPELSAILDKKYGLKKAKKESNKHVRNGKKDTTRQVQT